MTAQKNIWLLSATGAALALIVTLVLTGPFRAQGQRKDSKEPVADTQWEYMVVAGGNVNFTSISGDQLSGGRKQNEFPREASVIERNLDKLGAKGWELVSVYGLPNDPIYYLKRKRNAE